MAKFYVTACLIVLALTLSPLLFLGLRKEYNYDDKIVFYNAYSAKVKSIDPATCGDTTSATMQAQTYEGLYTYHYLKRPVEIIPQLAAAMPDVSDNGLVYTIKLKPDIRYTRNPCFGMERMANGDSRPGTRTVTADDFILGFKRIADFHIPTPLAWSFLAGRIVGLDDFRKICENYQEGDFSRYDLDVEGLKAVDNLTLQIRLAAPYPQLVYVLAIHNYAPVPGEVVDYHLATVPAADGVRRSLPVVNRTAQITRPEQVVGTGAFFLSRWEPGSLMVFERNPEYHHGFYPTEGEPSDKETGLLEDAGKPLPLVDVLHFECVLEDMPAWLRFLSQQYDVSGIPRDVFNMVITPDKALAKSWEEKGIRLVKYTDPAVFWLGFNMADPIVGTSKSLRQAMCLAFNVEDYVDVLQNGRGRRAVNILPESFPGHDEAGPGPFYRHDLDAARRKLADALIELKQANQLDAEGRIPTITIDLGGRDEMFRRIGEFIQQQFEPLGLRVRIELNDWPTLQQKVHNKQSQLYTMGWHADYPDPENFLQLFYSPNIDLGTNNTNYRHPEFDRLYDQIKVMPDEKEREPLYIRMVKILNEDCPVLLLSEPVYYVLKYDWVEAYKRHPFGYGMTKHVRVDPGLRREMGGR